MRPVIVNEVEVIRCPECGFRRRVGAARYTPPMPRSVIHRVPYRAWLLGIFLIAFIISAIRPLYPTDFWIEHSFTGALLIFLFGLEKWGRPLSNAAYTLLTAFMLLHVLGAHYTYSFVPYDAWAVAMFGRDITTTFNLSRNHYDRLVHFAFGLLLVRPMAELVMRWMPLRSGHAIIVAVLMLATLSKVYELIEWWFAIVMSPENAELFNGQQGDAFDAHKDMALALAGAIGAAIGWWMVGWRGDRGLVRNRLDTPNNCYSF